MATAVPKKVISYTDGLASSVASKVSGTGLSSTGTPDELAIEGETKNVVLDSIQQFNLSLDQTYLLQTQMQSTFSAQIESLSMLKAPIESPTFTGAPKAPTPTRGAVDKNIATTDFVAQAITDTLTGLGSIVPVGTISLWSGTLEMTPAGWQVCDGTNGTPDLRGRFVLGANNTIAKGTTGGTANAVIVDHTHTATSTSTSTSTSSVSDPGHSHYTTMYNVDDFNQGGAASPGVEQFPDNQMGAFNVYTSGSGTGISVSTSTSTSTTTTIANNGVSGTDKNLPPYYALYYIMKLADVATPPATTPLYTDTTNGRVGVNVANPTVALDVSGATKLTGTVASGNTTITGFASVSTSLQVSGNTQIASLGIGTAASGTAGEIRATNNITAYYSDDRFKTRLGNIENALDKIDQLSGFYYEANELAQSYGYEKIREVGVSAQDTQKVMNEIVAPAPVDDRYLTVRYEKFAPLLIEGIKELRVELNKIKTHLNI